MPTLRKTISPLPPISVREISLKSGKAQKIYCMGNLKLLDIPGAGFCGSRKVSPAGISVAEDCAVQIAQSGYPVISGYAAGRRYDCAYRRVGSWRNHSYRAS